MDPTSLRRSEAFVEDLPDARADEAARRAALAAPMRLLPWFTVAVALVGGGALTVLALPL